MPTITHKDIEAARTAKGGFTRESLAKLGVPWPPQKGWLKKLKRSAEAPPQEPEPALPESVGSVKVAFDGGTPCNIPSLGYGHGYGSYRLGEDKVTAISFNRPMSANAAEIWTAAFAARKLLSNIGCEAARQTDVHFLGDSQIALKWCRNYKFGAPLKGSQEFRDAIHALHDVLKNFRSVRADWWPRENSVKLFGH